MNVLKVVLTPFDSALFDFYDLANPFYTTGVVWIKIPPALKQPVSLSHPKFLLASQQKPRKADFFNLDKVPATVFMTSLDPV